MKHLINIKTGETSKVSDQLADKLVASGNYHYISKTEFKTKPDYIQDVTPWITVKSSNLDSIRYSKNDKLLFIRFLGGSQYVYKNVPEDLFQGMLVAESKGKYFWKYIRPFKDSYPYKKEH